MNTHAEISINEILGSTLDSRDEAIKLFTEIKEYCTQCGDLSLDFSGVEFMSRSFADQFHKEKMDWFAKSFVTITICNASTQIVDILKAVAKTQHSNVKTFKPFRVLHFSDDQLFDYFKAI